MHPRGSCLTARTCSSRRLWTARAHAPRSTEQNVAGGANTQLGPVIPFVSAHRLRFFSLRQLREV